MIALSLLLIFAIYLTVAVLVTRWVTRIAVRRRGKRAGLAAAVLSVTVFVLIPIWDELLGLVVYRQRCETESGITIYGTMALPNGYYGKLREPLFLQPNGDIDGYFNKRDRDDQTDLYRLVRFDGGEEITTWPARIKKDWDCMYEKSGKKLACSTSIGWGGGWWKKIFSNGWFHPRYCSHPFDFKELSRKVFYPEASEN